MKKKAAVGFETACKRTKLAVPTKTNECAFDQKLKKFRSCSHGLSVQSGIPQASHLVSAEVV